MTVYYDPGRQYNEPRLHPYAAAHLEHSGHIDFKLTPEKIETALEDFIPFNRTDAVKHFYDFLRWINGPDSTLETTDCALRPPAPHQDTNSTAKLSMHGRMFIMYRNIRLNCSYDHQQWLCGKLMQVLKEVDPEFAASQAVVGFSLNPVLHTAISNGRWIGNNFEGGDNDPGLGEHVMLSFWAYGDDESIVLTNLRRVFDNIWAACRSISDEVAAATRDAADPSPE
jgi:hypothetical protein